MLAGDVPEPGRDVGDVVAGPVGDGDPFERGVGLDLVDEVRDRPGPGPLLGLLGDLPVLELDHGLDVEQRAEQGPGAADAPAALQVLEPAQHAVDAGARGVVLGRVDDVVDALAGGRVLGGGDDEEALAHGERVRIDDADGGRGERVGPGDRRGVRGRDLRRDREAQDGLGALVDGLLVGGLERAGGGGGGLGQVALPAAAVPELRRRQIAAVLELLGAEADGQRHDDHAVLLDELVGQVAGTVGHDVDAGHAQESATVTAGQPAQRAVPGR